MTTSPEPARRLRVERYNPASDIAVPLGTLQYGARGKLSVAEARPGYERLLADIVNDANARDEIVVKVPPPPGGKPLSVYQLSVGRAAPDLLDRLMDFFEQKYDLLLTDEAP